MIRTVSSDLFAPPDEKELEERRKIWEAYQKKQVSITLDALCMLYGVMRQLGETDTELRKRTVESLDGLFVK